MSFGFENVSTKTPGNYLRTPGLHKGGKFVELKYDATPEYEYVDIVLEDATGATFRDRSFGPQLEKVYPKQLWENGQPSRMETKEEAFARNQNELSEKIFHLAMAVTQKSEAELKEDVKSAKDLKSFVEKVNAVLPAPAEAPEINFLTIWRNSDAKQKSNLAIPDKIRWVETASKGANGEYKSSIRLTAWQEQNQLTERYKYQGSSAESTSDTIIGGSEDTSGDLPF